ncbi:hypothetical protein F5Y06DRAFT_223955 [Hypoxylon sp. FL0890]|nr:hypothetical protein F5Y06DRAFT_223955 [Hypoxylon sp. FL0890]
MYRPRIAWPVFASSWLASLVYGQGMEQGGGWGGWVENQVNSTLCWWHSLRVATLKDVVYMDGGDQQFVAGKADGSTSLPTPDENRHGYIWTFNFSTPFNTSTNFSSILGTISKAPNGDAANNFAPNYYDGALLANNDEFFLYGGLLSMTSAYSEPDADTVLGYMESQYGPNRQSFLPGFLNERLPNGMTRYVTFGGAANAPSENKAWYFGGYRSPSWGPIYQNYNTTVDPSNVSSTFITLDMSDQQQEVWTNVTLPTGTPSRANPSVVWVPVGEQGILVVIGGVTYPDYNNVNGTSMNPAQSNKDSPGFMSRIDVYDIAGNKWYQQPTQSNPPQYAKGCAVLGVAQDYSSFNIYYYGGYNGIDEYSDFNDDVWILSLPTFMWMKVSSGTPEHARAGLQCVTPYPDQMITIGGRTSYKGNSRQCLDGDPPGFLQVYNMTACEWMDSYDPNSWDNYKVPEMIHMMIGGDYSGGATLTAPNPGGWATSGLGNVFATPYNTTKLTTYYPYSSVGPGNGTRGEAQSGGGGGTPGWVGAVLGVVLGLVFITAVVVGILLYRRRRLLRKSDGSQPSTDENGRIKTWIRDLQSNGKAPTVTSDETRTQFEDMESRGVSPGNQEMRMVPPTEIQGTTLVELMDTSPRSELMGDMRVNTTGFTPIADMGRSPFASNPQTPLSMTTPLNHSFHSNTASHDHESSISSSQGPAPPAYTQRPDSPPLGKAGPQFDSIASVTSNANEKNASTSSLNRKAVISGVSGLSEREAGHLRQISDATVSSDTGSREGRDTPTPTPLSHNITFAPHDPSPPLPVSPPSVAGVDGSQEPSDYVSVHGSPSSHPTGRASASSPQRRSIFVESEDDLGQHGREGR